MSGRFEGRRLGATLRAFRSLRHEFASPLSAAMLHLELARRAALRANVNTPEALRDGLETGMKKLGEAVLLLDVFSAIGEARGGEPGLIDFGALVPRVAVEASPEFLRGGTVLRIGAAKRGLLVDGFEDEIERATRDALLAVARWAGPGEGSVEVASCEGIASLVARVPLAGERPGGRLFRALSRQGAGLAPWLARWTFEAHGGSLEGNEDESFLVVRASLPQAAPR